MGPPEKHSFITYGLFPAKKVKEKWYDCSNFISLVSAQEPHAMYIVKCPIEKCYTYIGPSPLPMKDCKIGALSCIYGL